MEPIIQISHLSKAFRLGSKERPQTLVEATLRSLLAPLHNFRRLRKLTHFEDKGTSQDILWALKDVSLDIQAGDVVGIIGRNGAGKSTLLKILSRITEPTSGTVRIHGRISSLLEVGTGFHPELTGRENIFLNGTILGMTRAEIELKFDAIVAFADLDAFLDTPVKRYSSGMYVRLAFAVAAHLEPDILLVDEVLAVGDLSFQKKCLGKMNQVSKESGRTIIFVSHNMGTVAQLCNKVVYMQNGTVVTCGPTNTVIERYLRDIQSSSTGSLIPQSTSKPLCFTHIELTDQAGTQTTEFDLRFPFHLHLHYQSSRPATNIELAFRIYQASGHPVFTSLQSECTPDVLKLSREGTYHAVIAIPGDLLMPGDYFISAYIHESFGPIIDEQQHCIAFTVHDTGSTITRYQDYANMGCILLPLEWSHEKTQPAN